MSAKIATGIDRFLPAAAIVVALYIVADTIYWTIRSFNPLPFWDAWVFAKLARTIDWNNFLTVLWQQHNEHRLVVTRLIGLADMRYFGGAGYLDLAAIWLMQLGGAAIVIALGFGVTAGSFSSAASRIRWRVFIVALTAALLFSAVQLENLTWSIQTCFIGAWFLFAVAFLALKKYLDSDKVGWLAAALAATVLSMLCLADGAIAPLIVGLALLVARRWRAVAVSFVVFAAGLAAYLHGYVSPPYHEAPLDALQRPATLAAYIAVYLGNIFDPIEIFSPGNFRFYLSGAFGLAAIVAVAALLCPMARQQARAAGATEAERRVASAALALYGLVAMGVTQGIVTALGRINFGLIQALSSRYTTAVFYLWIALFLLTLNLARRARLDWIARGWAFLALLFCVALGIRQAPMGHEYEYRGIRLELVADALRVGVTEKALMLRSFSNYDFVMANVPYLIQNRLSSFSRYSDLIGRPFGELVASGAAFDCAGAFDRVVDDGIVGGVRVSGWAWLPAEARHPDLIVLVDAAGTTVGLATSWNRDADIAKAHPETARGYARWQGYSRAGRAVAAYVFSPERKAACKLKGILNITATP